MVHITVVPASNRTGEATIRSLLADPSKPSVKGVYRNLSKVLAEFASNDRFEAVQGTVDDASTLDFSGSDAILNITPMTVDEVDLFQHALTQSNNVKAAAQKAGVKRLVLLSSVGAQYDSGTGEVITNHAAEVSLKDAAPEVVFVRCHYFVENWATALETINAGFFYSTITPLDFATPMIAVKDIGETLAGELVAVGNPLSSTPYIFELHGPVSTSLDVKKAFEEVLGREIEVRAVPTEGLLDFYNAVFPPHVAKSYVEMTESFLPGGIMFENPNPTGEIRHGKTGMVEVFRQWFGA
ncbi:hypothetical protein QBC35DRAFT_39104 [Podospora australis]|uniref:NAD(P)-binding domain-containing protein n=1 Tax=Podospora australis TaxID=1536484 RepID=A0AAN6WMF1_9PEZI|nr:hypothetical protein QBC35DRAFT_39104 [Podospora australis]